MKSKGPKVVPCRTPCKLIIISLYISYNLSLCFVSEMYDFKKSILTYSILFSLLWFTESKAFARSKNNFPPCLSGSLGNPITRP